MIQKTLLAALLLAAAPLQPVLADVMNTYNVETDFDDGTAFKGSFTYDVSTQMVTAISGTLYDSMGDNVSLMQMPGASTNTGGVVMASAYLNNVATPFTNYMAQGAGNAFANIEFNAANPTLNTGSYVNDLVFMDCTSASGMGSLCSTGNATNGTMGSPTGETITFVSSSGTAPVPLPPAVWSFLTGTLGLMYLRKRKTPTGMAAG